MITPEQEMRAIVEAVPGGCWHKPEPHKHFARCLRCDGVHTDNPSPTDLNALMEIAEKLDLTDIHFLGDRVVVTDGHKEYTGHRTRGADTMADALRKALYAAIKDLKP